MNVDAAGARVLDGYARLYALLAVTMLVVSTQPLFAHVIQQETGGERISPTPPLWVDFGDGLLSSETVTFSVLLVALLLGLLAGGSLGGRSTLVADGIVVAAVLLSVVLLARPGYPDPPLLTAWGHAAVVVAIATAVLALAHRVHLWAIDTRASEPSEQSGPSGPPERSD